MHPRTRTLCAAALFAALAPLAALAHDDDPKLLDRVPPYQGPGIRTGLPGVEDARLAASVSADPFDSSSVRLLSWIPLNELGEDRSGNDCWGYMSPSGPRVRAHRPAPRHGLRRPHRRRTTRRSWR